MRARRAFAWAVAIASLREDDLTETLDMVNKPTERTVSRTMRERVTISAKPRE
jgi:hypothetical protein